jgi:DNA invertase Pin-like site-specific DNA recombinase
MNGVAIYARVSHAADQELGGQVRDLEQEVERRGLPLVARYLEKVSATGRTYREEYDRLLRDAADPAQRFEHLFVWSLDRFSREETFTQATQTILDLEKLGVKFHSLKEPMLDTPADGVSNLGRDVLLALLPVIASYESRRRSERTRLAMRELKEGRRQTRSGRPVGRPRRVTPEAVGRAEVLRRQGFSWSAIAQRVGLPSGTLRAAVHKVRKAARDVP